MPNHQPPGGALRISVGIDIAKEIHWVAAIDADGVVQIDRKLLNAPADIAELIEALTALHGTVRIGLDVIGGIAGLAEAMLAQAGFALVHVPGIAVNRARQGSVGGENKSDPRDARTIADQVRTRSDLRLIEPATELDLEIKLLVSRRGDLVQAQTQRLSRQCYTCQTQPQGVDPVSAWDDTPRRVWSLLDMLLIRMVDYLELAENVAQMGAMFIFTDAVENDLGRQLTDAEKRWIEGVMKRALLIAERAIIPLSEHMPHVGPETRKVRSAATICGACSANGIIAAERVNMPISSHLLHEKVRDIPQNGRELDTIRTVILGEIGSKKFFFVPDYLAKHYDRDDILSDRAARAFPSCRAELRFSGNCLACGEWTASVFHTMRAAEIGVRLLAKELGVSFPDKPIEMAEWHQLLDNADAKIKAIGQRPKSAERDADQVFFSQAATEFRYFKDGWRVRVAHARASYSENEALRYTLTCATFSKSFRLASPRRLDEPHA